MGCRSPFGLSAIPHPMRVSSPWIPPKAADDVTFLTGIKAQVGLQVETPKREWRRFALNAEDAVGRVDSRKWRDTPPELKLSFLRKIRENLGQHMNELLQVDCEMKGIPLEDDDNRHQVGTSLQSTTMPVGGRINACIELYEPWWGERCQALSG